ncbi:MAG: hypothetical protein V6D39_09030 [Dolichospermum lemmermannii FEM_B0920]
MHHSLPIPRSRNAYAPQHPQTAIPRSRFAHNPLILDDRSPNLFLNGDRSLLVDIIMRTYI